MSSAVPSVRKMPIVALGGAVLLSLVAGTGTFASTDRTDAERAFAELLFGRYFLDPCANTSQGTQSCPPDFAERRIAFQDSKATQTYRFEQNRCIVHADTRITATGQTYQATFNLQNVLYVNLNKAQQEANLTEVELYLQGEKVLETADRTGNVLVFVHKYFATDSGEIGHDVTEEVLSMRKALKAYQELYCGGMG
ncbi:MAG: hypothetical protein KL863_14910 [Rhizobium sp.]|nr:hypothetical protein [Rhizobium sp.]